MKLVKTELGQRVLKDRSVSLSPRQRAAFILCDGKNHLDHVLASTAKMGVTREDVDAMVSQGLLEPAAGAAAAPAVPAIVPGAPLDVPLGTTAIQLERSPQQRYQDAYPIATKLTASLGLRGFRLNLAVEGAGNFEQLRDLSPRIREAVGDKAFAELERALNG